MENSQETSQKKPIYKRWWVWGIGIVVILAIIGSAGDTAPEKVGEDNSSNESQKEQQTVFTIGDQIKIEDTILTVTDVDTNWKSSNQFDTPQNPNDVFVVVSLSLQNQGDEQIDLSGLWDFQLEDANGVIHDQSISGVGLNKLTSGSLAPGGQTSGDIIFEVPQEATSELTLHYEPLFSFRDKVKVEL